MGAIAYGAAWGDYDGDGDPDLYVANYAQANNLYRNEGTTSKWLSVGLASTVSAPDGNGARVTAVVGSQRQTRTPDGGRIGHSERGSGALWFWPDGDECRFAYRGVAVWVGDDADGCIHERYADAE